MSFRLFINLWMKDDVQLMFNINAIIQRESVIADKKRILIKYHFFNFEKNQEHFIKQYVREFFSRSCRFRKYIKRHFRITIDYDEYNIVYVVFITIKKKFNNKVHRDLLLRASWYEKQRHLVIKTMTRRFQALTNIAALNIFFLCLLTFWISRIFSVIANVFFWFRNVLLKSHRDADGIFSSSWSSR